MTNVIGDLLIGKPYYSLEPLNIYDDGIIIKHALFWIMLTFLGQN